MNYQGTTDDQYTSSIVIGRWPTCYCGRLVLTRTLRRRRSHALRRNWHNGGPAVQQSSRLCFRPKEEVGAVRILRQGSSGAFGIRLVVTILSWSASPALGSLEVIKHHISRNIRCILQIQITCESKSYQVTGLRRKRKRWERLV